MNAGESTVARVEVCIVAQDVNQLNKEYTKDNSIASNCHVHIYFTPNLDSGGATAEAISKNLGKHTIKTVSHSDGGGLFKGSNSESFTGRELMTADEVSHMSSEKELVFVAGHKPIFGDKLRYYLQPFFLKRLNMYQGIYIKEHGCEAACKKYTSGGKHDCARCVEEYKKANDLPPIPCPTYPLYSDHVTRVLSFEDLFAVHAADKEELSERSLAVQMEKEHQQSRESPAKEEPAKEEVSGTNENTLVTETESGNSCVKKEGISLEKKEPPGNQDLGNAHSTEDRAGNEKTTDDDNPKQGQAVPEPSVDEGARGAGSEPEIISEKPAVALFVKDETKEPPIEDKTDPQEAAEPSAEEIETSIADEADPVPVSDEETSKAEEISVAESERMGQENEAVEEIQLPQEEPSLPETDSSKTHSEQAEETLKPAVKSQTVDTTPIQQPVVQMETRTPRMRRNPHRPAGFHENPYRERERSEDTIFSSAIPPI